MTITDRVQGAGLCLLFAVLCLLLGRSLIQESRAASFTRPQPVLTADGPAAPEIESSNRQVSSDGK